MASEILYYVNQYRGTLGLEPILMDKTYASAYAVEHTKYMIQQNKISHDNFSDRAEGLNSQGAQAVAENVGFGYNSAKDLVTAWINSPSHRDTMEGNYTHSGIGALQDGSGVYYVTQLFYRKQVSIYSEGWARVVKTHQSGAISGPFFQSLHHQAINPVRKHMHAKSQAY